MPRVADWSDERRAEERAKFEANRKRMIEERESAATRAQAEHQRFADEFAAQQGIDPSKVTMHICRRGAAMVIEAAYRCVNGHDRCNETSPGPHCPYCERV